MNRDRSALPSINDIVFEMSRQHIAELRQEAERGRDYRKTGAHESHDIVILDDDRPARESDAVWEHDVA